MPPTPAPPHSTVAALLNSTLAFWAEHGPDWEQGGFFTTLDRYGEPILGYSTSDKYLLTSARQASTPALAPALLAMAHARPRRAENPLGPARRRSLAQSAALSKSLQPPLNPTPNRAQVIAWATLALQHPEDERGWGMAQRAFEFFNASALYDPADGLFRYQAGAGRGGSPGRGLRGASVRPQPCGAWQRQRPLLCATLHARLPGPILQHTLCSTLPAYAPSLRLQGCLPVRKVPTSAAAPPVTCAGEP